MLATIAIASFLSTALAGPREIAEVVCSGICSGSVPLRDGLTLRFTFANAPTRWDPNMLTSRPTGEKNAAVDSITVNKGGKILFNVGSP